MLTVLTCTPPFCVHSAGRLRESDGWQVGRQRPASRQRQGRAVGPMSRARPTGRRLVARRRLVRRVGWRSAAHRLRARSLQLARPHLERRTCPLHAVASLPALRPWATPPPAERGPSPESIYRVSLTVDLCEGNKIVSFKKFISPQPVGAPQKEKIRGPGHVPTCAHWLRRPWFHVLINTPPAQAPD